MSSLLRSRVAHLLCCAFLFSTPALHATPAQFAGTIVDSHGQPLAGVTVQAGHQQTGLGILFVVDGQATTDTQGNYAIVNLGSGDGSGTYLVTASLAGYVPMVYPNRACIQCLQSPPFLPTVTPPAASLNFTLLRSASLSGHLMRTDKNIPEIAFVYATSADGTLSVNTQSGADGNYQFPVLYPGQYRVYTADFFPDLVDQIYAGHDYDETYSTDQRDALADLVTLDEGSAATGIDFELHVGAKLTGSITSALDGTALSTRVNVRRRTPVDSGPGYTLVATSQSYLNPLPGQYASLPLAPGSVTVYFGESDYFADQYYPNAADEVDAQNVTLNLGQVASGIDAQLTPTRIISGTVTDDSTSQPIDGALVHVMQVVGLSEPEASNTITDVNGSYRAQGLGAVDPSESNFYYYVWAGARGYIPEYYPGGSSSCCVFGANATSFPLPGTQSRAGIDIPLEPGAYASGRVYDADTGYTRAGIEVDTLLSNGHLLWSTFTDANGYYWTTAVPVGQYYLVAHPLPSTSFYFPDYKCSGPCTGQPPVQTFSATQEYAHFDFVIPNFDLIFRGAFDQ
ncbi:MAG TPA: carboxypeptidase regulatory-like domain-containing protein [Rudaea sp.]|nr:carboxypeptidase regulatory-like domain-containing protein [Rudaea sp.]